MVYDDDLLLSHDDNAHLREKYPHLFVEHLPGLAKKQRRTPDTDQIELRVLFVFATIWTRHSTRQCSSTAAMHW